jgi:hypothetical protein
VSVRLKAAARRAAVLRGHRLGEWVDTAWLPGGFKAQCRACGRHVIAAGGKTYGDALAVQCDEGRGSR